MSECAFVDINFIVNLEAGRRLLGDIALQEREKFGDFSLRSRTKNWHGSGLWTVTITSPTPIKLATRMRTVSITSASHEGRERGSESRLITTLIIISVKIERA